MEKLLTIAEAAEILGVEYKTVYRLVRSGEIPAGRVGRVYRIKREDLETYFESTKANNRTPTALKDLHCCISGKRIVSNLDIGGYAADTGEPISAAAWEAGCRTSTDRMPESRGHRRRKDGDS